MPHTHVHPAPMSNAANAAHQANVGIDNTNMFSNAAAELSTALQQLISNLSAAARSRIKAWDLAGNSMFTRPADLAGLSAKDIEQLLVRLRPDWPFIALPTEVPPVAGMPSPVSMPNAAAHSNTVPSAPVSVQPLQATPIALPVPPVFRGGGGKLKLRNLPRLNGDRKHSTPRATRQWLSAMQLALRQDREADPVIKVMFAVTHVTEYAADRRDIMFLPQYSVSHLIPWSEYLFRLAMLHWKSLTI